MSARAKVIRVGTETVRGGVPSFEGFVFSGEGVPGVIGIDYTHDPPLMGGYTPDELRAMIVKERQGDSTR